jgi:hypothetical protein
MKTKHSRFLSIVAGLVLAMLMLSLGGRVHAEDAQWYGQFWNNKDFAGAPALTRYENSIDFNWGGGSPAPQIADDNFSARWVKSQYFSGGTYRFTATMDDAMRIWVDGQIIMDYWYDSQEHTATADVNLTQGDHDIRVDYYEAGGVAVAKVSWQPLSSGGSGSGGGGGGGSFVNWKGEYFNNVTLTGTPALIRDDRYINFDWGTGSPAPQIFNDYFSVRWTKTYDTVPGLYRFFVTSDDGARAWANGQLIFNNWQDQAVTTKEGEYYSPGGPVTVVVEYYEGVGGAVAKTGFLQTPGGIPPTPPPPTNQCPNPPVGLEGVVINASVLNVRSGPGTEYPVIGRLTSCEKVALTGYRNQEGTWVMIWLTPGVAGWVNASYMQLGVPMSQLTPV